jgi:hypothetical protein
VAYVGQFDQKQQAEYEGKWDWKGSGRMQGTITLVLSDEVFIIEI